MLSVLSFAFFVVHFFFASKRFFELFFRNKKHTFAHALNHFPEAFNHHHRHLFDVFEKRLGKRKTEEEESVERKAANSRVGVLLKNL